MLQRKGVTDSRWTKATFPQVERRPGPEVLRGGREEGTKGSGHSPVTHELLATPAWREAAPWAWASQSLTDRHISTQWDRSCSGSPFLPEATGEDTNSAWRWEGWTREAREGDLDPGHFRQRGKNARGGYGHQHAGGARFERQ